LSVKKPRLILIGMGTIGFPSRVLGYSFGSILTYGHLGKKAAPGQVPAGQLVKAVRSIYD
jgi:3-dehydroquinate dehydratase type I